VRGMMSTHATARAVSHQRCIVTRGGPPERKTTSCEIVE
jgi:hypothetical protein